MSRGWIRSEPDPDRGGRRYWAHDVTHLDQRSRSGERRRGVRREHAPDPLRWNDSGVDTAICGLIDGELVYRGRRVDALSAAGLAFADAAELLWASEPVPRPWAVGPAVPALPGSPVWRMAAAVPLVAAADAPGKRTPSERARRLLLVLAECLADAGAARRRRAARDAGDPTRAALAALGAGVPVAELDAVLLWLADGPVDDVTTATRGVAATGADLYASVGAGLAVLSGPGHAGAFARAEALLAEAVRVGPPELVRGRLAMAAPLEGVVARPGPAARAIAARVTPDSDAGRMLTAIREARLGSADLHLSLAAWTHEHQLGPGAAAGLCTLARAVGLVAHAQEQQAQRQPRWPRTRYIGSL